MADQNYFGQEEPWVKHLSSTKEYELSKDPAISSFEDLQPSPRAIGGDAEFAEEAFTVYGSHGIPRVLLGVFVIRRALSGKLYTRVEE